MSGDTLLDGGLFTWKVGIRHRSPGTVVRRKQSARSFLGSVTSPSVRHPWCTRLFDSIEI
jgi:hypothetical protein